MLVDECKLELNQGCRYGLIGDNGSGKSNVSESSWLTTAAALHPTTASHPACPLTDVTGACSDSTA